MTKSANYFANARTISELEVLFASATSPTSTYMGGSLSFEEARHISREDMKTAFNERMAELLVENMDWTPCFLANVSPGIGSVSITRH